MMNSQKAVENVSFKVYLKNPNNGTNEVKRFVVDSDAATSVTYLKEKLISIFPEILQRADFALSWTDEDEDNVVIDTDEELVVALTEIKGPIYKIICTVKGVKDTGFADDPKGEVHVGVTCDGCEGEVAGSRYKCTVCENYDLCGACEAAGTHAEHNMVRIAAPENAWPEHFFRRLSMMHGRMSARRAARAAAATAAEQAGGEDGSCGAATVRGGLRRGRGGGRCARMHCGRMASNPTNDDNEAEVLNGGRVRRGGGLCNGGPRGAGMAKFGPHKFGMAGCRGGFRAAGVERGGRGGRGRGLVRPGGMSGGRPGGAGHVGGRWMKRGHGRVAGMQGQPGPGLVARRHAMMWGEGVDQERILRMTARLMRMRMRLAATRGIGMMRGGNQRPMRPAMHRP